MPKNQGNSDKSINKLEFSYSKIISIQWQLCTNLRFLKYSLFKALYAYYLVTIYLVLVLFS